MSFEYKHLLPNDFHAESRVWIYQCNRLLSMTEALDLEEMLNNFLNTWNSHGIPVKGYGNLFLGQFIVLIADENATGVSGCSTDSSVRLIKDAENKFGIQCFERTLLAFIVKDKIQMLPLSQLQYGFENGFINADTLYFNNLVSTLKELQTKWIIPVRDSWLWGRLQKFENLKI